MDTESAIELIKAHAWVALAAVAIGAVVRMLKSDALPPWMPVVPARWRPLLALGLGQVAAVLDVVSRGTPWQQAVLGGLVAAAIAVLGHETGIESIRNGEELSMPKASKEPTNGGAP